MRSIIACDFISYILLVTLAGLRATASAFRESRKLAFFRLSPPSESVSVEMKPLTSVPTPGVRRRVEVSEEREVVAI